MKQLHKLIIGSYIGPFLLTFGIALFFLVMQFLWKYIDDLMGKGLDYYVIFKLLVYASAHLVSLALPLAILLSSIMVMGSLAEHYELVAMKSAGLSLFRILAPLLVFIFLISVGAFFFTNKVWPVANLKFKSLLWDITQKKPAINIRENIFYNEIKGYTIRVKEKKPEKDELIDVLIYDHTKKYKGNRKVIRAEKGIMKKTKDGRYLILTLFDGEMYQEMDMMGERRSTSHPFLRSSFSKQVLRFDLMEFQLQRSNEKLWARDHEMLDLSQLEGMMDSIDTEIHKMKKDYLQDLNGNIWLRKDSNQTKRSSVINKDVSSYAMDSLSFTARSSSIDIARNMVRGVKNDINLFNKRTGNKEQSYGKYNVEWHRKFTISFACVILFFIGAPLGAIIRKGGLGAPLVASVLLFLLYHILSTIGQRMAEEGVITTFQGMWLSSMTLLPLGVFLTYKAAKDSKLFSFMEGVDLLSWFKKLKASKK